MSATLLIVHHAPTANTRALRDALVAGSSDDAIAGVALDVRAVAETDAEAINAADGVLLLSPANFGYMAGMTKDLFDRTFLAIGGALAADGSGAAGAAASARKPWALCVHGRYDTTGAVASIENIAGALPWRRVAPVLSVLGDVGADDRDAAYELGGTIAALLSS